jgi:type I restriction enzyme R subunit
VPRADLATIVLDAEVIEDLMTGRKKDVDPVEVEKWITTRIAKHVGNPVFVELGKRLAALREKYAHAQQASLDFLKELFALARDNVAAEKAAAEIPREARQGSAGRAFRVPQGNETPIIV